MGMMNKWRGDRLVLLRAMLIVALSVMLSSVVCAQVGTATKSTEPTGSRTTRLAGSDVAGHEFPPELVNWKAWPENPIFTAGGPGHWDVKIRERGWVMREGDAWRL